MTLNPDHFRCQESGEFCGQGELTCPNCHQPMKPEIVTEGEGPREESKLLHYCKKCRREFEQEIRAFTHAMSI
jgi:hypothetical protein